MTWKKQGFDPLPKVEMEQAGDKVVGQVVELRTVKSPYGEMDILILVDDADGEFKTLGISAGLARVDWVELVDRKARVMIEYEGRRVNPKTQRTYKAYSVYTEEEVQEPAS